MIKEAVPPRELCARDRMLLRAGSRALAILFRIPKLYVSAFIITLSFFTYFLSTKSVTSLDTRFAVPVAISILKEGNIHLDEFKADITSRNEYGTVEHDGHIYNYFPLGPSLAALPVVFHILRV